MDRRDFLKTTGLLAGSLAVAGCANSLNKPAGKASADRPNILFCISDDQSWLHTSINGCKAVKTPNFDRIAKEGVLFTHAFCAAPSCTPSRSAILTGQEIWRLEEGGLLRGALPGKFKVYTDLLEAAGYHVGYTHKGWDPGNYEAGGWDHNPAGRKKYSDRQITPPASGIKTTDYARNFEDFLKDCPEGLPFCFWYGGKEPHRVYEEGSGLRAGKRREDAKVPAFLPDTPEIRSDILDYCLEIEWFDEHLGRMIRLLEEKGKLDNTLIVVTSDNGMPFPRAKTNLYDYGTRMPLAIRWAAKVKGGRVVDDLVTLTDMAPTFLDAAGLEVPYEMTGRSLLGILLSGKSGRADPTRDRIFTAIERHTWCRPNGVGYPSRAIRTYRWLYIRNYAPDRRPAGDPDFYSAHQTIYGDIDNGATKTYMIEHKSDPRVALLFELCFGKRPAEELYDVTKDPDQVNNLAADPSFAKVKRKLSVQLEQYQRDTKDPRVEGKSPWDHYPYYYGDFWKRGTQLTGRSS
ncbi:MAG TPA: sulfatase-like hydrolase/transferase [Sedimentisphaerales bacterium]|nr:sulfatase-like hydrolase/transferase [Sedimentisphaerales bacterium]